MGLVEAARIFRTLGDPTRMRIAAMLAAAGERCVCVIAHALRLPQCAVSRHLGAMRAANLVEARREGTWMYYRLRSEESPVLRCLRDVVETVSANDPIVKEDLRRLAAASCSSTRTNKKRKKA